MTNRRTMLAALLAACGLLLATGESWAETATGTWYSVGGKGKDGLGYGGATLFVPSGTWKPGSTLPEITARNVNKRECPMELAPPQPPPGTAGHWVASPFKEYSGWVWVPNVTKYPSYLLPPDPPASPPPTTNGEKCVMNPAVEPGKPPPPQVKTKPKRCVRKKKGKCVKWE